MVLAGPVVYNVLVEASFTGPKNCSANECSHTTDHVNNTTSSKVDHRDSVAISFDLCGPARFADAIRTDNGGVAIGQGDLSREGPGPVDHDRVDEGGDESCVHEIG